MTDVPSIEQVAPLRNAALAPALADDAPLPIQIVPLAEGIVAAYSPAQMDRPTAWSILTDLYGALRDVTPDWVVAAA